MTKPEKALRDQFVLQIYDQSARDRLLDEAQKDAMGLNFLRAINLVKNFEATKILKKRMLNQNDAQREVNLELNRIKSKVKKTIKKLLEYSVMDHDKCKCPAFGRECNKFKKMNHC